MADGAFDVRRGGAAFRVRTNMDVPFVNETARFAFINPAFERYLVAVRT